MTEVLCTEFAALGHEVRLATLTTDGDDLQWPFEVIRRPSLRSFFSLLRWCDIHIQANISLKYILPRVLRPRSCVYRHGNVYQRDDGTLTLLDRMKRFVARHTPGIANSQYTAAKLGCMHTILNSYDERVFFLVTPWMARDRDLVFLGRLVSQKGCDGLLQALSRLRSQGLTPNLTIIGDGPDRAMLEALSCACNIAEQVRFTGTLQGSQLARELNRHRVLVVPSSYEEPFGIVALEGLACGCLPVVSERGGLVDAVGPHGFTFPNGDDMALAEQLSHILGNLETARLRLNGVEEHLSNFQPKIVAERYIAVFNEILQQTAVGKDRLAEAKLL